MEPVAVAAGLSALLLYVIYRRWTSISIKHIPGPEPESWLLGNMRQWLHAEAGEMDFKWQEEYGGVIRFRAPFGEECLLISDPKAIQYIYNSGYKYRKHVVRRELSRVMLGKGLIWSDSDSHKRQRRMVLPAFGASEVKGFMPFFLGCATSLSSKWREMIITEGTATLDLPDWLNKATLDAIGEAAFDHQFECLEGKEPALRAAFATLAVNLFKRPSTEAIIFQSIIQWIPIRVIAYILDNSPSPTLHNAREAARVSSDLSQVLIERKTQAFQDGQVGKDVMSLLVQANMSENDATKLTHTEMLSQVQTVIGAGHETTANTLTWALYELAKHPEMQNKLRAEIYETKKNMLARGRREFTPGDFEGMEYLQTVMKETLRIHPVVYYGMRESTKDTVLPLSKPITTTTGEIIDQLPIPKGMALFTSIAGYNRYKDLFGEDSHIFNPDRWLREDIKDRQSFIGVGVGGLMTFGSGNRSCVGWRFAMLEFSTFLTELIQEFVFALPDNLGSIRREACMVMIPQVEGQKDGGARLPLLVSLAPGLEDY